MTLRQLADDMKSLFALAVALYESTKNAPDPASVATAAIAALPAGTVPAVAGFPTDAASVAKIALALGQAFEPAAV